MTQFLVFRSHLGVADGALELHVRSTDALVATAPAQELTPDGGIYQAEFDGVAVEDYLLKHFDDAGKMQWIDTVRISGSSGTFLSSDVEGASATVQRNLLPLTRAMISGAVGTGSTTTIINIGSIECSLSSLDQVKGRVLIFHKDTSSVSLQGQGAPIDGSTTTAVTIAFGNALTTAPASGDTFTIY